MGCTSSKLDDLPAVKLCRERCYYLDEAIRQRYAFSDSHSAYIQSLKGFGFSLDRFFDNTNNRNQDLDDKIPISASSSLRIPSGRKVVDSFPNPPPPSNQNANSGSHLHSHSNSGSHLHSHSHSGSHLQFHSDSEGSDEDGDGDDDGDESSGSHDHHLHDHHGSHFQNQHHFNQHGGNGNGNGYMTMNYMRNHSTQSVVYEQRPMSPETVHFGESSSSFHQPYYSYPNDENNHYNSGSYGSYNYPPQSVYSNYGGGMGMGGGGGFFGSSAPYGSYSSPPRQQRYSMASSSGSKPPPPPPSPPRASTWDFLDPFTSTFEKYYPPQTPSRDSREVREEEGIPELEDEDYQNEVVKEVHGNQRLSGESGGGNFTKNVGNEEAKKKKQKKKAIDREDAYQTRNIVPEKNQGVEYQVHLVEKNFVAKEEQPKEPINVAAFKGRFTTVSEVVREIKAQFERSSDSGIEVAKILEAGKLPYNRKNAVYHVSSKMLHSITPSMSVGSSQPSTPPSLERDGSVFLEFNGDIQRKLLNLSSTLQKLYNWEKKLYEEVKAEEKMRLIHERKSRRLKRMDEKGAEAHKVDATRILVQTLSTKIRIAIQVVAKISVKINKLRDEELFPQINQLIHGLIKMWAVMLECHRNQCQAIAEAKNLDAIAFNKNLNDDHLEASVQLELELLNWILRFSSWVIAQKAFVKALNSWLLKCLLQEPEETEDGLAPFSPGRIGAPPVFVICNQWFRAMERISEKEVLDTMRVFAASVHHLCEQHNVELRQRMTGNRDLERRVKAIEREEQKMHKALQVVDKQMVLLSGQGYGLSLPGIVEPSDTTNAISLQSGLKRIFESMERFMASSMQAYAELRVIGEEARVGRENAQVT
ncbi:hypothetical protein C5167_004405 [Papaver somniferum]|uniref:DUF632 domain-containing protein n=1 Tax=Papaver somniferum TaxID=3469 RepID=A0A4Y7JAK9_PAPSO|nr:uncharacterized protein LOC113274607 [Papaver somniferum]RZC57102.1 hypothetical protein C5167_004405 [Papaver somniferum]